jgi:hypothetical protein
VTVLPVVAGVVLVGVVCVVVVVPDDVVGE